MLRSFLFAVFTALVVSSGLSAADTVPSAGQLTMRDGSKVRFTAFGPVRMQFTDASARADDKKAPSISVPLTSIRSLVFGDAVKATKVFRLAGSFRSIEAMRVGCTWASVSLKTWQDTDVDLLASLEGDWRCGLTEKVVSIRSENVTREVPLQSIREIAVDRPAAGSANSRDDEIERLFVWDSYNNAVALQGTITTKDGRSLAFDRFGWSLGHTLEVSRFKPTMSPWEDPEETEILFPDLKSIAFGAAEDKVRAIRQDTSHRCTWTEIAAQKSSGGEPLRGWILSEDRPGCSYVGDLEIGTGAIRSTIPIGNVAAIKFEGVKLLHSSLQEHTDTAVVTTGSSAGAYALPPARIFKPETNPRLHPIRLRWNPSHPSFLVLWGELHSDNFSVSIFDSNQFVAIGEPITPSDLKTQEVISIKWHPNGDLVTVLGTSNSSSLRELILWDVSQRRVFRRIKLPQDSGGSFSWSPDGRRVAVFGESLVHVVDTQRGRVEKVLQCAPLEASTRLTNTERVPFSNRTITYENSGGSVHDVVWTPQSPDLLRVLIISVVQKNRLEDWDVRIGSRTKVNEFDSIDGYGSGLSRDGKRLLIHNYPDRFSVFETGTAKRVATVFGSEADWWTDNEHLLIIERNGKEIVLRKITDETDSIHCTDQMLEAAGIPHLLFFATSNIQLSTDGKLVAVTIRDLLATDRTSSIVFLDSSLKPVSLITGQSH